jgi:deoxyribodipyrimidine photo-lyase
MTVNVMWFRRDLRLRDNPALPAAAGQHGLGNSRACVVPLFVVDPALWKPAGEPRRAQLVASLRALSQRIGGPGLAVRHGDPVYSVVLVAAAAGASAVHAAADFGPYGRRRDEAVANALAERGIEFVRTGSPYAVAPGRLHARAGGPLQVFTPFFRAWLAHSWLEPAPRPRAVARVHPPAGHDLPDAPAPLGRAGEEAALRRWRKFRDGALTDYPAARNIPGIDGTSDLWTALKYGELHPRTLLADLPSGTPQRCRRERRRGDLPQGAGPAGVPRRHAVPPPGDRAGVPAPGVRPHALRRTGAGNGGVAAGPHRVSDGGRRHAAIAAHRLDAQQGRMIVASFLVKDLHLECAARRALVHAPTARRGPGLQPVELAVGGRLRRGRGAVLPGVQSGRAGREVRSGRELRAAWIPELRHLAGGAAHAPWDAEGGYAHGYPQRIVDHAAERREALRRLETVRKPGR